MAQVAWLGAAGLCSTLAQRMAARSAALTAVPLVE
jgi:hypothetical protein